MSNVTHKTLPTHCVKTKVTANFMLVVCSCQRNLIYRTSSCWTDFSEPAVAEPHTVQQLLVRQVHIWKSLETKKQSIIKNIELLKYRRINRKHKIEKERWRSYFISFNHCLVVSLFVNKTTKRDTCILAYWLMTDFTRASWSWLVRECIWLCYKLFNFFSALIYKNKTNFGWSVDFYYFIDVTLFTVKL